MTRAPPISRLANQSGGRVTVLNGVEEARFSGRNRDLGGQGREHQANCPWVGILCRGVFNGVGVTFRAGK